MSSSREQFKRALNYVQNGPKTSKPLNNETKLKFYALYKQITEGPNKKPKPGMFDFVARAKWDAWKKLGNMSKEEAEKEYVRVLDGVSPNWREWNQNNESQTSSTASSSSSQQQQQQQQPRQKQKTPSSNKNSTKTKSTSNKKPSASPSTFNPHLLDGKVAFVTGGGSGICKGVTEMLMRHGAKAVIMSRNMDKLKAAAQEMEKNTGGGICFPVSADVRDTDAVSAAVDQALNKFGRIDLLINGAAGNFLASAEKLSYNAFQTVMNIDTVGTFNVSKIVYQKYLKEHGGSIINMSMTLHWTGMPLQAHAGSAKAGVDAMTKHLAVEWGLNNVRVNAIAIGPIAGTEGFRRLLPKDVKDAIERAIPLQRWGSVEDIGNATLYLASDAASWINGSILTVDGGSWMTTSGLGYPDMFSRL